MSGKKRIRAKSFRGWFRRNVSPADIDTIRKYGVGAGIPGLIYYSDTLPLYERFKDEIWTLALGKDGRLDELLASQDTDTPTHFANFMVWAAATRLASE